MTTMELPTGTPTSFAGLLVAEDLLNGRSIRVQHASVVPGLLQTEDYARGACVSGLQRYDAAAVERMVAIRIARHLRLMSRGVELRFLLDEAALCRQVGTPAQMAVQLWQLEAACRQSHVAIRVMPFACGLYPGAAYPYDVLHIGTDLAYLYREDGTDGRIEHNTPLVAGYWEMFWHVWENAPDETASRDIIASYAAHFEP